MLVSPPEGIRIVYTHMRLGVTESGHLYKWYDHRDGENTGNKIHPRGGETIAKVVDSAGRTLTEGRAVCSMTDNYVKETGRTIALERALWGLTEHRVPSLSPMLQTAYEYARTHYRI